MKLSWGNWWKLCSISKNVNSSLSPPSHFHFPCSVCISRPALQSWGHLSLSLPRSFNISLKLDPSSFTWPTFHWPLVHFLIFILIFLKNMEFWEGGRVGWIEGAEISTPRKGWKGTWPSGSEERQCDNPLGKHGRDNLPGKHGPSPFTNPKLDDNNTTLFGCLFLALQVLFALVVIV